MTDEQQDRPLDARERGTLRDLAKRVAEAAALPIQAERRRLWIAHNKLKPLRPMILVFPEGSWRELLPETALQCEGKKARRIELSLRARLYYHDHIHDDTVIEGDWPVHKRLSISNWGLEPKHIASPDPYGAYGFDPVIREPGDLAKLRYPVATYDEAGTREDLTFAQDLLGDILDVRLRGVTHVSFHLMQVYIYLRGLSQVMVDMYDNPGMLHDAMAFLEEGYRRLVQQFIDLNLLDLNNDYTYHSSGGVGYTDELPKPDYDPARVRPCDMWSSAEAQEMAQVSPAMHAEFILPYEKRLLAPFGLNGYGCCEDLTHKLQDVLTIPNLRRISISPFANVERCAQQLEGRYIFSWKPHPAHLVGEFDAQKIRQYIQHTLEVTRGCVVEIILKDTHTCESHPERFTQWTDIARKLIEQYA